MFKKRRDPVFAARSYDPTIVRRVQMIGDELLPEYLTNTIMGLNYVVDQWKHHNGPEDEVRQGVDAIIALWSEIERRGGVDKDVVIEYGPEHDIVAGLVSQSQEPYAGTG